MAGAPAVVWEFDGVVNADTVDGRFVWADRLAQDWGVDLRDALAARFAQCGHDIAPAEFLAYWFEQDARPDPFAVAHLDHPRLRHVIGTNNEARRARYIETAKGFGSRVARVLASGRMGCAKPDAPTSLRSNHGAACHR